MLGNGLKFPLPPWLPKAASHPGQLCSFCYSGGAQGHLVMRPVCFPEKEVEHLSNCQLAFLLPSFVMDFLASCHFFKLGCQSFFSLVCVILHVSGCESFASYVYCNHPLPLWVWRFHCLNGSIDEQSF